jgi:hypothetical protein
MSEHLFPLSGFEVGHVRPENLAPRAVFVHGIRSERSTFEELAKQLRIPLRVESEFSFLYFDYHYRQSIAESGSQLADALKRRSMTTATFTVCAGLTKLAKKG